MKTILNPRRGVTVLVGALALAAILVVPAGAKPKPAFAPKIGAYNGDSFAEGKSAAVVALVKKKGSKLTAEVEIAVPAKCQTGSGPAIPTELHYKVLAPIKGRTLAFKGESVDLMKIVGFGAPSDISLTGKFTSSSAFTANVTVKAPAEGAETETHCSVPGVKLKFDFAIAV